MRSIWANWGVFAGRARRSTLLLFVGTGTAPIESAAWWQLPRLIFVLLVLLPGHAGANRYGPASSAPQTRRRGRFAPQVAGLPDWPGDSIPIDF